MSVSVLDVVEAFVLCLSDVRVPAQVHAAHATGLVEMREGPFQALAAQPQQAQAARAANASTIAIHRVARRRASSSSSVGPRSGSEM